MLKNWISLSAGGWATPGTGTVPCRGRWATPGTCKGTTLYHAGVDGPPQGLVEPGTCTGTTLNHAGVAGPPQELLPELQANCYTSNV